MSVHIIAGFFDYAVRMRGLMDYFVHLSTQFLVLLISDSIAR